MSTGRKDSMKKAKKNKPAVALALGSGGARGYTHIGVIDVLEERGYNIISVAGCSMGAIVGGFYCSGKLSLLRDWAISLSYLDVLKLVDLSLLSNGAIRGDKAFNVLADILQKDVQIENLNIPFTAVATNITHKKEVWFQRGSLNDAMRASAAIPGLLTPASSHGCLLVDGGVLNPLPITPCVSAHADYIMAVDLNADVTLPDDFSSAPQPSAEEKEGWFDSVVSTAVNKASEWLENKNAQAKSSRENLGKLEILSQMFEIMQASLSDFKTAGYPPDLMIHMPTSCCEMYEFYRAQEMIDLGRHIATKALDAFEQKGSSLYGSGIIRG